MTVSFIVDAITAALFLMGATLTLLAAIGILRLPDTFLRMQASSKASTLGLACLLAGAAFQLHDVSSMIRLGSIAAFIMLTAPLSAHIVARATLHRGAPLWKGSTLNEYDPEACAPEAEPPAEASTEASPEAAASEPASAPTGG